MALLHIALEDGFEGEPVTVTVNGKVVFEGSPQYDLKKGFAQLLSAEVSPGATHVSIEHAGTERQLSTDVADAEVFVRATVRKGVPHYFPPSTERRGYV